MSAMPSPCPPRVDASPADQLAIIRRVCERAIGARLRRGRERWARWIAIGFARRLGLPEALIARAYATDPSTIEWAERTVLQLLADAEFAPRLVEAARELVALGFGYALLSGDPQPDMQSDMQNCMPPLPQP